MRILVQKVKEASCTVDNNITGSIKDGLLLFVGFTEGDNEETIKYLVQKVLNLRIFEDSNGVMNESILQRDNYSILSISQFTLYADTKKGNRPSYINALKSEYSEPLYNKFNEELNKYINVETGIFGADMKIKLINDGPTTIMLEK